MSLKTTALVLLAGATIVAPELALASVETDIFGNATPFETFLSFVKGPFAIFLSVITIIAAGAMLAFGSDMSGFARRIPSILLGLGFILGATSLVTNLFGASGAVLSPEEAAIHQSIEEEVVDHARN